MTILLVSDSPDREPTSALVAALVARGGRVAVAPSVRAAAVYLRAEPVRALVLPERLAGDTTHCVALLAEWRNPLVATVLLSDRAGAEVDEVVALLPSVTAVVAPDAAPAHVAAVVLGAMAHGETPERRLARRWREAGGEALPPSAFYPGGPLAPHAAGKGGRPGWRPKVALAEAFDAAIDPAEALEPA